MQRRLSGPEMAKPASQEQRVDPCSWVHCAERTKGEGGGDGEMGEEPLITVLKTVEEKMEDVSSTTASNRLIKKVAPDPRCTAAGVGLYVMTSCPQRSSTIIKRIRTGTEE